MTQDYGPPATCLATCALSVRLAALYICVTASEFHVGPLYSLSALLELLSTGH